MDRWHTYMMQGWMMEEPYNIVDGNELKVYMVLYGLSKSDKQGWRGSVSALANYTHTNERTCKRILDRMMQNGLIVMEPKARKEVWIRTLCLDASANNGNKTCDGQVVRGNGQNAESIRININNKEKVRKERSNQPTTMSSWERWEQKKAAEANKVDDSISWDEYVRQKQLSEQT